VNAHDRRRQREIKERQQRAKQNPPVSQDDQEKAELESLNRARKARRGKTPVVDAKGKAVNCTGCKGEGFGFNRQTKRWEYCLLCGGLGQALK
jgi:hypothetical protein